MAGPIRISILASGRQAKAEMRGVATQAGLMGRAFRRTAGLVGGVFAVTELVRAGKAVAQVGGEYVSSLNKIQALTDSSRATMARAARSIERDSGAYAKMGQTTGDAAAGVVELTKAGMSLSDSLKAVRATMTLAKAGEMEVADASTLVANTINTFSLKARQAADIANYLANAANISSADVKDIAESFKYVSPIAAKAGVSLAQTSAVLAELSNSGVKASQAGTGFRKFLLSLEAPTGAAKNVMDDLGLSVFNAQGKMLPLSKVIQNLQGVLGKMTQEGQTQTLRTIFGLTGLTSAQIILKNGAKGLADYTKGVQRARAAQKLANAASKGLKGTMDSLKASVISSAQAWYREYSPAINRTLQDAVKWLKEHKTQIVDGAHAVMDTLVPAAEKLAKAFTQVVVPLAKSLVPSLKTLVVLAGKAADAFTSLPDPVRKLAVQVGFAALILRTKLFTSITMNTAAISTNMARLAQWRAEMTYTATRAEATAAATAKIGAAARTAAGVGGLILLMDGFSRTTEKARGFSSAMQKAGGAALVGFSVGGPVGGAVGLVGGLGASFHDLQLGIARTLGVERDFIDKTTLAAQAAQKMKGAIDSWNNSVNTLAGTLGSKGFITGQTRLTALTELNGQGIPDLTGGLTRLGVPIREIGRAAVGNQDALDALFKTLRSKAGRGGMVWINGTKVNLHTLADAFDNVKLKTESAQSQLRKGAKVTQDFGHALDSLPKRTRNNIQLTGVKESVRGVAQVASKYKSVNNKTIKAILKVLGVKGTVKDVREVQRQLEFTRKAKGDVSQWVHGVTKGVHQTVSMLHNDQVKAALEKGPRSAKADLSTLMGGIRSQTDHIAGVSRSGGLHIGSSLSSGVVAGIAVHAADSASATLVENAIASARKAADAHSPSRKAMQLGNDIGDGLALGMRARERHVQDASRRLTSLALTGRADMAQRSREVYQLRGGVGGRHTERVVEVLPSGPIVAHVVGFGDVAMQFVEDRIGDYRAHDAHASRTVYSGVGND